MKSAVCTPGQDAVSAPLARRRWWYVMPIVFITYSLAYLDRANYSFAAAAGMARDLNITKGMSSLIGSLFFLGYFFFQIPGAMYAQHRSVKKLIFVSLVLWGTAATLTGMISSVGWLLVTRFMLGAVEAAVLPAMLIYLGNWFTKRERSRANTFLMLGNPVTVLWMSVASGYLVRSLGWRWMFIIEGAPAILWAVVWWMAASERPADAKWLDKNEKETLAAQLAGDQAGLKTMKNYREAFRSPEVLLLCLQYFCWSLGIYGFVLWLPSILKDASTIGIVKAGWLSSVPYLLAICAMISVSHFCDRSGDRKAFIWPWLLLAGLAFCGLFFLGTASFWVSFALLALAGAAMYAPYGPFFALIPEILPKNVAGGAIALINSMGALGAFVGSYLVGYLNGVTGGPGTSYLLMAGALLVAAAVTRFGRFTPDGKSSPAPHASGAD
ncbi:MAG: kguT [Verrucomicrobia bacterium]|nr:kguT [Verrucomicrobiota bacterium]